MDRSRRERLARILEAAADRLPRALVGHAKGISLVDAVRDADWWRGSDRFLLPRPDALDHWEATRIGDPWAFIDLAPRETHLGLQVEGTRGLRTIEEVLLPRNDSRLDALLAATGRLEGSESAALRVWIDGAGRWRDEVVADRVVPTVALGEEVLRGLLDAVRPHGDDTRRGIGAIRIVRIPLDEDDPVAMRREMQRLVSCWRPLWGVPRPKERYRKPDLDARLKEAYRRSLRLIAGSMGPAERAALRLEVRDLQIGYRDANLQGPRLLDVVAERVDLM